MNRGQHTGADQERSQQAEGKRSDGQDDGPVAKKSTLFCHGQGMDQCGADQPGQEGGVFDRVPKPPAAPAQFVIRPPGTHRNADRQANPGRGGPGPRPARPGGVKPAIEQGGDGKSKRHRHADVTHVQHGRVKHQAGVLQQRIQIAPIGRNVAQAQKRIGGDQHEQQETDRHQSQNTQHPRYHHLGQLTGKKRHRHHPGAQHHQPQQQRAFVPTPNAGNAVDIGQFGIGMLRHISDGEVIGKKSIGQTAKGECRQQPQRLRAGACQRHPVGAPLLAADHAQNTQRQRHKERQDQRKMTNFRNHGEPLISAFLQLFGSLPGPWRAGPRVACSFHRAWPVPRWQ